MKTTLLTMGMIIGAGAGVQADIITNTLNAPGDLTTSMHTPYTGTPVSQSLTGGLGGSGALDFRSGNGNQAWFSNASYAPLKQGQTLSTSLYFQYFGGQTTSIKLGFATDPNASVNGYAMPNSGSWAYFGVISRGESSGIAEGELYGSSHGYLDPAAEYNPYGSFTLGNWYQMSFGMMLMNEATSEFQFSYALKNSDVNGTLGGIVYSGMFDNQFSGGLDTTLYTYIGMENPTATGAYTYIDNISMTSEGIISSVVPEPSAAMLIVFGVLAMVGRRRTRSVSPTTSVGATK